VALFIKPPVVDTRFSAHGIGVGKRLRRASETGPRQPGLDLSQQWDDL
jgi:hypothetical protein